MPRTRRIRDLGARRRIPWRRRSCRTPRSRGQKLRSKSSFLPSSWLLLGDQSVLELLPQPVAQVVVLGFGHLGLALVETSWSPTTDFSFRNSETAIHRSRNSETESTFQARKSGKTCHDTTQLRRPTAAASFARDFERSHYFGHGGSPGLPQHAGFPGGCGRCCCCGICCGRCCWIWCC